MKLHKPYQQLVTIVCLLLITHYTQANTQTSQTSDEIIKELKSTLPNQAFDLKTIIGLGVVYGQSFKQVQAQKALVETSKLDAESHFVPKLNFSLYEQSTEEDVVNNSFSPVEADSFTYEIGLSKYFTSGTGVEFSYSHLDYKPVFRSGALGSYSPFFENTASVKLSQSLWKDSFGKASRSLYKAGRLAQEAQEQQFQRSANQWFSNFANQLYNAWATQQSAKANLDSFQRRKELLNIAKVNRRRGNTNSKDYYQLEASVTAAEIAYNNSLDEMHRIWQNLIITLSLPQHWIKADPMEIPLKLDDPMPEARTLCASSTKQSIAVTQLEKNLEAAKLNEKAAKSNMNPSLNLVAQYSANSIDEDRDQTQDNLQNFDHPTTALGIEFTMPLSFASEKSEYLKAYANKLQLEAQLSSAKDQLASVRYNSCRALKLQTENISRLSQIVVNLKKRENLEYKDFRTGRTSSFNYIQSGVDAISAEINYIQAQTNIRLLAWQIISESKNLSSRIEDYAKSMHEVIK